MSEEQELAEQSLRAKAREAGLLSGAVYRGELWPIGTLVRMAGPKSKVTYRITDMRSEGHRLIPPLEFTVQLTPLQPGPGRSVFWTDISYLRKVDE